MPFSPSVRASLAACAEASLPAGARLPAGGERTVRNLAALAERMSPAFATGISALARIADGLALRHGRLSIESVPLARRFRLLESWRMAPSYPLRLAFRSLLTALKSAHYNDPELYSASGCRAFPGPPSEPAPRWMSQVVDLSQAGSDEQVEADVVVVGSGAGGGAAARALAEKGLAVVILESGPYLRRGDFTGPIGDRVARMYRQGGIQSTLGNVSILVPTGNVVGGTTTINEGSCLRLPPWVVRHWREKLGVPIRDGELDPLYARVDAWLEVGLPEAKPLGVPAQIIARGAEALGLAHGPVPRNAPGCDGQGVCSFGCPTGAKRSTDVSLIPAALSAGAMLFTGAKVRSIDPSGTSVTAVSPSGRKVRVQSRAVVVAAGSLRTPGLLRSAGIRHPWLGRNLSLHPALGAVALFPHDVAQDEAIPQGWGVDGLREQGFLFEGAGTPFALTALAMHLHGPPLVELLEQHRRLLTCGFSIREASRGRVVQRGGGEPQMLYRLGSADVGQLQFGLRVLLDLLARAGATRIVPPVWSLDEVAGSRAGRVLDGTTLAATDFDNLSAYHPLGTTRMGVDPRLGVVDMDLRVRGAPRVLVCDGGVIPSSLGVNPQMTIMALSLRAAERLADGLA